MATRKQKATELVQKINRGPALNLTFFNIDQPSELHIMPSMQRLIEIEMIKQYRLWVDSWILPEVLALVPELRSK